MARTPTAALPVSVATAPKRQPMTKAQMAKVKRQKFDTERNRQVPHLSLVHQALTAASKIVNDESAAPMSGQPNSLTRIWEMAVLGYAQTIPELGAVKMLVGNCHSRIRLKLVKVDDDGEIDDAFDGAQPVTGLDPEIAGWGAEVLRTLRSGYGGQSELLRQYGENMFLIGELWLVPMQTPTGWVCEVLSILELAADGTWPDKTTKWKRILGDGAPAEHLPQGVKPIRVWRRSNTFGNLASSSVQACLVILEELDILTRLVKASALSGMALSGMVAIPDEADSPDDEAAPDNDEAMHPLLADMMRQGCRAVEDPGNPAAFMPYLAQMPGDVINKIKHIPFMASGAEHVVQRAEAIQRLAMGLDVPVEWALGHQSSTFTNATQITESAYKIHLRPSFEMLCDALTQDILWPYLANKMGLSPQAIQDGGYPPEILSVAIHYDASELVSHPDKTADIIQVVKYDKTQMMVAKSEVRMALDLDPDGGPDDAEVAKRLDAVRLQAIKETIAAPATDAAVPIEDAQKAVVPGESAGRGLIGQQASEPTGVAQTASPATTTTAAPASAPTVTAAAASAMAVLSAQVAALGDFTIDRAVERVGARLRAKLKPDSIQRQTIDGVENANVAAILGPRIVASILGNDDPGFGGDLATFARHAERLAAKAGHPAPGVVAEALAKVVGQMCRDRMYGVPSSMSAEVCAPLLVGV